jgi:glycosyltransferase involved in cell wall biosynthesis
MIHIGILLSRLVRVGPVNGIYNRISATEDNAIKYTIFTFRPELPNNSRLKDFQRLNIQVQCLYSKNVFVIIKNLRNAVNDCNIDILDAHCIRTLFFGSFVKIKKIFTIHQNFYYEYPTYIFLLGNIITLIQIRLIMKYDEIICCAKYLEVITKEKIKKDNVYHILNSTLPRYLTVDNKNTDIITYIYIGSIDKRKRVKELCNGFSRFAKDNEQLICIGTGSDFSELENKYSNITLPGFKRDITEYLLQADYFISMSDSEGLPNVVIEALACKLPVILSDIPAHREFFLLNEKIGVLITEGLDKALEKIRNSNYEEMSEAAYHTYLQHLTSKRMAEEYVKHYKSLYEG